MKLKKLKRMVLAALCVIALGSGAYVISSQNYSFNQETSDVNQESSSVNNFENDNNDVLSSDYENAEDLDLQSDFSYESIPDFTGAPYVVVNDGRPFFAKEDKACVDPFEMYSELDSLGRCGVAYANICIELMPTEERGSIGQIRPSGWHTVKYNDLIDGNYLYNRCHLIGYQLAGENANELNLITGTRYLNMMGMLEFENKVSAYVSETHNHVLYRVTPWFTGDNLVADGVQIEAWSVEDSGEGVCFNVYCYNVQPGIDIDYATGDSCVSSEVIVQDSQDDVGNDNSVVIEDNGEQEVREYVLNNNTKKFHLPTCSSVEDMSEKNKEVVIGTIEEIKDRGYSPCARCLAAYR